MRRSGAVVSGLVAEIIFFLGAYAFCIAEWGFPWGWLVGWLPSLVIAWLVVAPLVTFLVGTARAIRLLK